jgi:hypothetical protein
MAISSALLTVETGLVPTARRKPVDIACYFDRLIKSSRDVWTILPTGIPGLASLGE